MLWRPKFLQFTEKASWRSSGGVPNTPAPGYSHSTAWPHSDRGSLCSLQDDTHSRNCRSVLARRRYPGEPPARACASSFRWHSWDHRSGCYSAPCSGGSRHHNIVAVIEGKNIDIAVGEAPGTFGFGNLLPDVRENPRPLLDILGGKEPEPSNTRFMHPDTHLHGIRPHHRSLDCL